MTAKRARLKIIPLGGLQEIGKNITAIEYGNDIIVIDCGMAFPEDEMLGIDLVIPDISYLVKNKEKVRGIILTHGHEDHIGALPYVLKQINVPVFGTRLTLGLVEYKLKEHGILGDCALNSVKAGTSMSIGCFNIDFIKVNHSIPDAVSLAIHTPVGTIVHTGDFKVDYTPIDGDVIDLAKFAELGKNGVLALLCDSTNVERKGYAMSESSVGETFDKLFMNARDRIIVASFASNVHRIQQVMNAAVKFNRKVAVCGRSMVNVVNAAMDLGYLVVPDGTMIDIDSINNYSSDKIAIITTGSQGEPMSALARMIASEHKKVQIQPGDSVIISATPIPGNEKFVYRIINGLYKKGANVIYEGLADVHVSGHACQEELKLIHRLVKPKYFVPVHGEYRHLYHHAKLAESLGMSKENIFVAENGRILEFTADSAKLGGVVNAGKVLIDGLGVGDVGNIVLRDRKHLSQDGLIVVVVTIDKRTGCVTAGPDIISRGFVYVREAEELMEEARTVVREALTKCEGNHITEWSIIKTVIKDVLREMIYEKTKRNPMILPIIMEI